MYFIVAKILGYSRNHKIPFIFNAIFSTEEETGFTLKKDIEANSEHYWGSPMFPIPLPIPEHIGEWLILTGEVEHDHLT